MLDLVNGMVATRQFREAALYVGRFDLPQAHTHAHTHTHTHIHAYTHARTAGAQGTVPLESFLLPLIKAKDFSTVVGERGGVGGVGGSH